MEQPVVTLPSGHQQQQQQLQSASANVGHQNVGPQGQQKPGFIPPTTMPTVQSQHTNPMIQSFPSYSLPS